MVIDLVMHGIPQGVVVVAAIIPYADGCMSASTAHVQRTTNACMYRVTERDMLVGVY